MSKTQRDHFYPQIVYVQTGEYCRGCGFGPDSNWLRLDKKTHKLKRRIFEILVIDHIDNDNSNNRLENLQLLCRSCNRIKNPSLVYAPDLIKTQSEATNKRAENAWRAWVMEKVLGSAGYDVEQLIFSGAELFKISPETIQRRYLPKMTSESGLFKIVDGLLLLKNMEVPSQREREQKKGAVSYVDV